MVLAAFAFRSIDGFISFNLEVSYKSIFSYKVNKVFCLRQKRVEKHYFLKVIFRNCLFKDTNQFFGGKTTGWQKRTKN